MPQRNSAGFTAGPCAPAPRGARSPSHDAEHSPSHNQHNTVRITRRTEQRAGPCAPAPRGARNPLLSRAAHLAVLYSLRGASCPKLLLLSAAPMSAYGFCRQTACLWTRPAHLRAVRHQLRVEHASPRRPNSESRSTSSRPPARPPTSDPAPRNPVAEPQWSSQSRVPSPLSRGSEALFKSSESLLPGFLVPVHEFRASIPGFRVSIREF